MRLQYVLLSTKRGVPLFKLLQIFFLPSVDITRTYSLTYRWRCNAGHVKAVTGSVMVDKKWTGKLEHSDSALMFIGNRRIQENMSNEHWKSITLGNVTSEYKIMAIPLVDCCLLYTSPSPRD